MTRFQLSWDRFGRLVDDGIEDLFLLNWQESGEEGIFDLDWNRAIEMEAAGVSHMLALRDGGRLVGYSGYYLTPYFHQRTLLNAVNDVIYAAPWARGGGLRLIREAERHLPTLGARRIVYHTKTRPVGGKGRTAGDLLAKLGYTHFEDGYSKRVG